jgi:integrase
MTDNGVAQVLQRGGREVVVDNLHAHQFRHTFAHSRLSEGGNEGNLMRLAGGWSRQMLGRYGASAATSAPSKPAAAWPPTTGGTSLKARTEPCPHFLLA